MTAEPVHRTIMVLDIVGFAHPQRTDPTRLRLRQRLYELVRGALGGAGIDPDRTPHVDLGDGTMVLLDPRLPASRVVEALLPRLAASLAAGNRRAAAGERLRLRVAVHRGEVLIDPHGFVGGALVEASRLSNTAVLREQLDAGSADLAVIVSDLVWRELLESRREPPDPDAYHPVAFSTHGVVTRAWVHAPGRPARAGAGAAAGVLQPAMAPVYRSILAVDIQGSTAADRTDPVKDRLRKELYRVLDQALVGAGVMAQHVDPPSDRGDGFLLLVHPVDEVPKTLLLGGLMSQLAAGIAAHNRGAAAAEELLLRAALHAGEVHHDPNGPFGNPIDVTFRLLEARGFKAYRRHSDAPLVVVVSGDLYQSIVWHHYAGIDPAGYRRLVRVKVAGRFHDGWVNTPDPARPPPGR